MSEKRMVYAEDVIQRIRDMAPEILGGWYNPYMENELEQLVCIVESTPTAAVPDVQRWRKTAEEPPTEKDSAHGKVLVKYMDAETKTEAETADHPCYHVTVYSPAIEKVGYAGRRKPKYTITVDNFGELVPDPKLSSEREYQLLQIPLEDGRFELVSTSLVEIEYY